MTKRALLRYSSLTELCHHNLSFRYKSQQILFNGALHRVGDDDVENLH